MVDTFGLMADSMKASGRTIKCTEEELLFGLMVESMKVNMKIRKSKATESSAGLMVALIKDNGVMENKMVEGYTVIKKGLRELAFGAEEKKLNGSSDIDGLVPY